MPSGVHGDSVPFHTQGSRVGTYSVLELGLMVSVELAGHVYIIIPVEVSIHVQRITTPNGRLTTLTHSANVLDCCTTLHDLPSSSGCMFTFAFSGCFLCPATVITYPTRQH